MSEITLAQQFVLKYCCQCSMAYAVPLEFDRRRREDGANFFCPAGHQCCYAVTEAQRLSRQLEDSKRLLQQAANREAALCDELRKTEAAKKRLAKRLQSGVCPVPGCKRHFSDLQRHIATKHAGNALPEGGRPKAIGGTKA